MYVYNARRSERRTKQYRMILIDMRSSILSTVFVLTIACALIVQTRSQCATCGGLGQGSNPCSCTDVVVQAAKLPKPTHYVSPQDIKDAATAEDTVIISTDTSSQDTGSIIITENSEPSAYSVTNTYRKGCGCRGNSQTAYGADSTVQSESSGSIVLTADDGSSDSVSGIVFTDSDSLDSESTASSSDGQVSSGSPGSLVTYAADVSFTDNVSGDAQNMETSDIEDTVTTTTTMTTMNTNGNVVVPKFSPIGDLCYPLPVEPLTGKIIEPKIKSRGQRVIVTPAYPGKYVCCPRSVPYEICVNTATGEMKTKTLVADSSDTIRSSSSSSSSSSGSSSMVYRTNSGSNGIPGTGSIRGLTSRTFVDTAPESGPFPGSNVNSYSSFTGPNSGITYNLPLVLNSASGQKQYAKMTTSITSADCFDDIAAAGETPVDYSSIYPAVPADAVSLTLAYQNLRAPNVIYRKGKQFVPEDKLSFGHRTVPADGKSESRIPDIAEEKLVTVDKPVVELKLTPPRTVVLGSYDEQEEAKLAELEAIERETLTQEDRMAETLITYKDLGYTPIGVNYVQPMRYNQGIVNGRIEDSAEEPCGPLGPSLPGYVPGSVVIQQDAGSVTGHMDSNLEIQRRYA